MKLRRFLKPLAFVGLLALYLVSLGFIGMLMLFANPLTDNHLPLRPLYEVWPFVMLVGLSMVIWQHRVKGVWALAVAMAFAPFGFAALGELLS